MFWLVTMSLKESFGMKHMNFFLPAALAILLSACASLDWSTARYASELEWSDFDPNSARIALAAPGAADAAETAGYPAFTMRLTYGDDVLVDDRFNMAPIKDPVERAILPSQAKDSDAILFGFPKEEARRFEAALKTFHTLTAEAQTGADNDAAPKGGSLAIGAGLFTDSGRVEDSLFCQEGGRNRISLWGRVSGEEEYRRVINNKRVDRMLGEALNAACGS